MDYAQETHKVVPKFTKKTIAIVFALVVILIIAIVMLVVSKPAAPAPAPSGTPTPTPTPMAPAPMPNLPVYRQQATGVWVAENSKDYTCPSASGADLTGNMGDYANYCIFDSESAAQNFCTSDASCVGYAVASGNLAGAPPKYQVTRQQPIPSASTNGTFFAKSSS